MCPPEIGIEDSNADTNEGMESNANMHGLSVASPCVYIAQGGAVSKTTPSWWKPRPALDVHGDLQIVPCAANTSRLKVGSGPARWTATRGPLAENWKLTDAARTRRDGAETDDNRPPHRTRQLKETNLLCVFCAWRRRAPTGHRGTSQATDQLRLSAQRSVAPDRGNQSNRFFASAARSTNRHRAIARRAWVLPCKAACRADCWVCAAARKERDPTAILSSLAAIYRVSLQHLDCRWGPTAGSLTSAFTGILCYKWWPVYYFFLPPASQSSPPASAPHLANHAKSARWRPITTAPQPGLPICIVLLLLRHSHCSM